FRDVFIVGGAVVVMAITGAFKAEPMFVSKLNTTLQIALAATILAKLGHDLAIDGLTWALIWATAITTFASGMAYLVRWTRRLNAQEESS
ncbi:MAG: CDP-alcohol phosphatidyltransferase family protein, partial [Tagaea sp.]